MFTTKHIQYLYMDIVEFSKPSRQGINQSKIKMKLNEIVFKAVEKIPYNQRILNSSGDGICIAVIDSEGLDEDILLQIAIQVLKDIQSYNSTCSSPNEQFNIRIAINEDEDELFFDVNGYINFTGNGIIFARRIMDIADEKQILIGQKTHNRLKDKTNYKYTEMKCPVKHHDEIIIYQYQGIEGETLPDSLDIKPPKLIDIKKVSTYEKEFKLGVNKKADIDIIEGELNNDISDICNINSIKQSGNITEITQIDTYIDDENLTLYKAGISLRTREYIPESKIRLTIKKRHPVNIEEGIYERLQNDQIISETQKEELLKGNAIIAIPYQIIKYISQVGQLKAIFKIENKRKIITVQFDNNPDNKADICLDDIIYDYGGTPQNQEHFEIEIKNKGASQEQIKKLADYLEKIYKCKPITFSKYDIGIQKKDPNLKMTSADEVEFKFEISGTPDEIRNIYEHITDYIKDTDFIAEGQPSLKEQTDIYLDDEKFNLYLNKASFRLRRKKDKIQLTLKKVLPKNIWILKPEMYHRIEEEIYIDAGQERDLKEGKPIDVFPYKLIKYLIPGCGVFKPILQVINNRQVLNIHLKNDEKSKAELCLDDVKYVIDGQEFGPFFEIEIEAKGAKIDEMNKLAEHLKDKLKLVPSTRNKYEKGLHVLNLVK
ncbi:MAG: CYTH domain-containing protein [Desulfobacterales bacterium]|nr:CYTH domain-containing protein [Desulfobacterales bacterium]